MNASNADTHNENRNLLYKTLCKDIMSILYQPLISHGSYTIQIIFRDGKPDRCIKSFEESHLVSR
jgi:hypothetical protein